MSGAALPGSSPQQFFSDAVQRHEAGDLQGAEAAYRRVLEVDPGNVASQNNLGNVLYGLGRAAEAEHCYRRALELAPSFAMVHDNLGKSLVAQGKDPEAEKSFRRACELQPDFAEAHADLGALIVRSGKIAEAERTYRQALMHCPGSPALHASLGAILGMLGRREEARQHLARAVELDPGMADAHGNLGNALKSLGELDEAERCLRRALEIKPDFAVAHSNLIFLLDLLERSEPQAQQEERARWYQQHAARYAAAIVPHRNVPDLDRKLRIGYVSADFRRHSAFFAFGPVLANHDHSTFEVVCYSCVKAEDDLTVRARGFADVWRPVSTVADEELAQQICSDRIDILVDLSGHSEDNRLLVFARKPAPVQVTAWGHPTGTGVKTIDWLLADPVLVPAEIRPYFAERIFDLPCERCYDAPEYMPSVTPLPSAAGQPFTYGYVNRVEKISATLVRLWGRILGAVPTARLLLKDHELDSATVRHVLLRRLQSVGVNAERVRLIGSSSHREHLGVFGDIDVCLDAYPQGGAISTAEALSMGVPVVSLCGRTVNSRQGAMNLSILGMHDWIAQSEDDFVRIAVEASRETGRLGALRASMRERISRSIFGDPARFTRTVENAYRIMWREWCARQSSPGPAP